MRNIVAHNFHLSTVKKPSAVKQETPKVYKERHTYKTQRNYVKRAILTRGKKPFVRE